MFSKEIEKTLVKKLVDANKQVKHLLILCNNLQLYIVEKEPESLNNNSYYLINQRGTWKLMYCNMSELEKTSTVKDIRGLQDTLNKLPKDLSLISQNDVTQIKTMVFDYAIEQSTTWWNKEIKNILNLMRNKIINTNTLKHIVGKSIERISKKDKKLGQKNHELLVAYDDLDANLGSVVAMRFLSHQNKSTELFMINSELFNILIDQEQVSSKYHWPKLSVLHHWSEDRVSLTNNIVESITQLSEKMPNIKMIVLRGCHTARILATQRHLFEPKEYNILSKRKSIQKAKISNNEFLFQQHTEKHGVVKTYIKFKNEDECVIKELSDIPLNQGNSLSLEVEEKLALAVKSNHLPLLNLPLIKAKLDVANTKKRWRNNDVISSIEKQFLKATQIDVNTSLVKKFPYNTLAYQLDKKLRSKGIEASIKGYVTPYKINIQTGTITDEKHDHSSFPRSLRKEIAIINGCNCN